MHRAHDYRHLLARWRTVLRHAGLRWQRLTQVGKLPIYGVRTPALQSSGGIYLSAGIHGDEPAGTEALLAWAAGQGKRLAEIPLLMLPCLNPWGLVMNTRTDAHGLDLNRCFHREDLPEIAAVRRLTHGYSFAAAMMLHEDYDGEGYYLYELQRLEPYWGEELLQAARQHVPLEARLRVEGRKTLQGLIRRRLNMRRFEVIGYPEAIWLHRFHAQRCFTVESPSEFALEARVAAHVAVIECMVTNARSL